MSVGETFSPSATTYLAICLILMTYLASSESALMILVLRATWVQLGRCLDFKRRGHGVVECANRLGACNRPITSPNLQRVLLLQHLLIGDQVPQVGRRKTRVGLFDACSSRGD